MTLRCKLLGHKDDGGQPVTNEVPEGFHGYCGFAVRHTCERCGEHLYTSVGFGTMS